MLVRTFLQFVERLIRPIEHRALACEPLPTLDRDVDIRWVQLDAVTKPPSGLCSYERRAEPMNGS
jgi:hypothetical protein